jgi:hypothetical protein
MDVLKSIFPEGKARDLIGGGEVVWGNDPLALRPYQALWLSTN